MHVDPTETHGGNRLLILPFCIWRSQPERARARPLPGMLPVLLYSVGSPPPQSLVLPVSHLCALSTCFFRVDGRTDGTDRTDRTDTDRNVRNARMTFDDVHSISQDLHPRISITRPKWKANGLCIISRCPLNPSTHSLRSWKILLPGRATIKTTAHPHPRREVLAFPGHKLDSWVPDRSDGVTG